MRYTRWCITSHVSDEFNHHAFVEDWTCLKQAVTDWLTTYEQGFQAQLYFVGPCPRSFAHVQQQPLIEPDCLSEISLDSVFTYIIPTLS